MSNLVKLATTGTIVLALVGASPAHAKPTREQRCQVAKLKLVAKDAARQLGTAARAGTDFSGDTAAFSSAFGKIKTSCNGDKTSLENRVDAFRTQVATALTPATAKCEAKKIRATAKIQACEFGIYGASILRGSSLDTRQCTNRLGGMFRKLEAKPGCPTAGDATAIGTAVDAFAAGVFNEVNGGTTGPGTTTTTSTTIVGGGPTTTSTTLPGTTATLAVVRVGDGTEDLSLDASASTFIDFFRIDGTPAGASLALPTAASGANHPFTLSGAETEGFLSRSVDGHYLTLPGYATAPGTASAFTTSAATVQRVIARIDAAGTIDTSTLLGTSAFDGNNVRTAATVDGSGFWVGGAGNPNGGIWYVTLGGGTLTQVLTKPGPSSIRSVEIFSGQLFASGNNNGFKQVMTVGTGLPTTAGQTATDFPGMADASPFAFVLFDRNPNVAGLDTLYVGDTTALPVGGIQK